MLCVRAAHGTSGHGTRVAPVLCDSETPVALRINTLTRSYIYDLLAVANTSFEWRTVLLPLIPAVRIVDRLLARRLKHRKAAHPTKGVRYLLAVS